MKKYFLFIMALVAAQIATATDSFSNSFEGESLEADGWTSYSAGGTAAWSQITYSSELMFGNTLKKPIGCGTKAAKSLTGGFNSIGKVNPSSWLISPKITVGANEALNYMMAYNASFNDNSMVTGDDARSKFDVLISTTTADTTAFTEVLRHEIHKGLCQYASYSIDLSKYAGQEVYIAFHEYATPTATPWLTNSLYIDNVKVTSDKLPDLTVAAHKMQSGTINEQDVVCTVRNFGFAADSYTLKYQVSDGDIVSESIGTPLASGDSVVYTFSTKAALAAGTSKVKVWSEVAGDAYSANDADSTEVTIYETTAIPYTLSSETAFTDFASTYFRRMGSTYLGWYFTNNVSAWIYTNCAPTESYLYSTKSYALPKGKVRIKATTTATTEGAKLQVYLTKVEKEFGEPVATVDLKTTLVATGNVFHIDVPEAGNYILALQPTVEGQVGLFGLELSLPMEDMMPTALVSPAESMLVNPAVPVTVKFQNDGLSAHENVKVSYQYGDNAVVTETIASIAASADTAYTFAQKLDLSTVATKTLKVWCSMEGDGNINNDTISTEIFTYAAKALPYSTSFESDEDAKTWGFINVDDDDVYWGIEPMTVAIDGSKALYLNYMYGISTKDLAISPALTIKKDEKYRLSFYYGMVSTLFNKESKIKVYLATSPDMTGMESGTLLADYSETTNVYRYANTYFTAPADGTYYVILYSDGGTGDMVVDDFRIDAASELVMTGAECSATENGYDLPDATVTARFANAGMTDLSAIKMQYTVKATDFAGTEIYSTSVTEDFEGTVAAGDTVSYAFKTPVSFPKYGKYSIIVTLAQAQDADAKNNNYVAAGPTRFETKHVPVTLGFEDDADAAAVAANGGWYVKSTTPYEGTKALCHSGKAADGGDWAFLNRINIPAGTYDFSFFWKTMTNNANTTARQSFEVYIGKEANAEAMTTKLIAINDTLNVDHKAIKELMNLTIAEDGNYFIGVKCTTPNTMGNLVMDAFTIEEPELGMEIPVGGIYTADFAKAENEWYHYHPTRTSSLWSVATTGDEAYVTTNRTYYSYSKLWTTPGIYEAPAFLFTKGAEYEVSYEYAITATNASTPLDGASTMDLYLADKDLPSAFTTLAACGTEGYIADGKTRGMAVDTITVAADGVYYLGFNPMSNVSAKFDLYSFSLKHLEMTGVAAAKATDDVTVGITRSNTLAINGAYISGEVYSISGMLCTEFSDSKAVDLSRLAPGIYIVKVATYGGAITEKIAIR